MKNQILFLVTLILLFPCVIYGQTESLIEFDEDHSITSVRLVESIGDTTFVSAFLSPHDSSLNHPYHGKPGTSIGMRLIGSVIDTTDTIIEEARTGFVVSSGTGNYFGLSTFNSDVVQGNVLFSCDQMVLGSYFSELDTSLSLFVGQCGRSEVFTFEFHDEEIHLVVKAPDDSTYYQRWSEDLILQKEYNLGAGVVSASLDKEDEVVYYFTEGSTSTNKDFNSVDTSGTKNQLVNDMSVSFKSNRFKVMDSLIVHVNCFSNMSEVKLETYDFSGTSKGTASIFSDGVTPLYVPYIHLLKDKEFLVVVNEPRIGNSDPLSIYHYSSNSSLIASGDFGFETVLITGSKVDPQTGEYILVGYTRLEYTDTSLIDNEKMYLLKGGLDDLTPITESIEIDVIPNPVKEGHSIKIKASKEGLEIDSIKIFDSLGKTKEINAKSDVPDGFEIQTDSLKPGYYILQIRVKGIKKPIASKFFVQ